jgi:hypothetical protein
MHRQEYNNVDIGQIGRVILIVGIALAGLGLILMFASRIPWLSRLGSLPGDIRIEGSGFTCLFPIVTTLLLSIVATIIINIVIRLINRP